MIVQREVPADHEAIRRIVYEAFHSHPQHDPGSEPTEHSIIDGLRDAGALTLSLVAQDAGDIIGHIAFSRVLIDAADVGWYGLGPLAVRPDRQKQGIGATLVREGLLQIQAVGAAGVVLVGEPEYYGRFGFRADSRLTFADVPPEYFLCLPFGASVPAGVVTYHPAFA